VSYVTYHPPGTFISHLTKCGFKRYGLVNTTNDFEIQNLDLRALKLDVGILIPFVIPKRLSGYKLVNSEQLSRVLPELDNLAKSQQRKFLVLVVGGKLISIDQRIIEDLGLCGVAIMDRSTIERVTETNDPETKARVLSEALVRYLGRDALSPYVSGRPASGGRFFGRSSLMKRIVPSAGNFTFIGNRRIGKTSLLKEIKERLKLNNVRTGEVYAGTRLSTGDFVYTVLTSLGQVRDAEKCLHRPKGFVAAVHAAVEKDKKPLALFIDEMDRILEFDAKQGWEVMNLLRETFEGHSGCRLFCAGFRSVMEASQSIASPMYNFTQLIEVPLFTRQETFEMVTKPLERMGIALTGTDLPEAIYQETSGHPELIQIHCAAVVRFMEDHNRVPSASELLPGLFNTGEYKFKVMKTLANTNPLEELLCYLLMSDAERTTPTANYNFKPQDVYRVLAGAGIELGALEIATIITNLKASGIVSAVSGAEERYRFSAPRLVDYCLALNLNYCIEQAKERLRDENTLEAGAKQKRRKVIFEEVLEAEEAASNRPLEELRRKVAEPAESLTRIKNLGAELKHFYLTPQGGITITEAEGVANFSGSIDPVTIDDLNNRCLEVVDHWTNHGIFEQRLRGIGRQLLDAIKLGAPDLIKHLTPASDRQQFVFVTNSEGLKIPFELLTFDRSNLAIDAAVSRALMNCRLPDHARSSFHQLLTSLTDTITPLRVLLVVSDPDATVSAAAKELTAVKNHIEAGCKRLGLKVEFVEIGAQEATMKNVEKVLVDDRPFHLWHFTGHGRHSSEDTDASGIFLIGDDGRPDVVPCKRLNRWLKGAGLWLTYLSSCNTSASSGSGRGLSPKYVGTMEAVVDAGIPSVIGFRWSVSDESAYYLADEFYRQLFEVQREKNLSLAMLEARRAVERRTDFFDAWASSMLITQYS
jgi:hypothetical protein